MLRTIDLILGYKLTPEQGFALESTGLCNGCGSKGRNLDKFITVFCTALEGFDEGKGNQLFQDFRLLCHRHDVEWAFHLGFFRSNLRLATGVYQLLHWAKWYSRIAIAYGTFASVHYTEEGKKGYNKNLYEMHNSGI